MGTCPPFARGMDWHAYTPKGQMVGTSQIHLGLGRLPTTWAPARPSREAWTGMLTHQRVKW
eukprot:c3397_g1_i1 orf=111-293(+)